MACGVLEMRRVSTIPGREVHLLRARRQNLLQARLRQVSHVGALLDARARVERSTGRTLVASKEAPRRRIREGGRADARVSGCSPFGRKGHFRSGEGGRCPAASDRRVRLTRARARASSRGRTANEYRLIRVLGFEVSLLNERILRIDGTRERERAAGPIARCNMVINAKPCLLSARPLHSPTTRDTLFPIRICKGSDRKANGERKRKERKEEKKGGGERKRKIGIGNATTGFREPRVYIFIRATCTRNRRTHRTRASYAVTSLSRREKKKMHAA